MERRCSARLSSAASKFREEIALERARSFETKLRHVIDVADRSTRARRAARDETESDENAIERATKAAREAALHVAALERNSSSESARLKRPIEVAVLHSARGAALELRRQRSSERARKTRAPGCALRLHLRAIRDAALEEARKHVRAAPDSVDDIMIEAAAARAAIAVAAAEDDVKFVK